MTAIAGLRRLPLVEPEGSTDAPIDRLDRAWDRPGGPLAPTVDDGVGRGTDDPRLDDADRDDSGPPATPDGGRTGRSGPPWLRPLVVVPVVAAALVGALGLALAQRDGERGPGPGEALVVVDGRALVSRADGGTEVVRDRTRLEPGDRLDMQRGTVTFELADDVRLEGMSTTSVVMDRSPRLRTGELLVDAPAATSVQVGPAVVAVADGAAARIARTFAVQVDVYRGRTEVSSADVASDVPALRSVEVAAIGEVGRVQPLTYDPDDRWDRRYLADAVALDRQLGPLAASLRAARVDGADLVAQVRAELDDAPSAAGLARLVDDRPVSRDLAIGLAVVGEGTTGPFARRWERGLAFHDAGAAWGLVAMDLGAEPDDVTATLRAALDDGVAVLDDEQDPGGTEGADGATPGGEGTGDATAADGGSTSDDPTGTAADPSGSGAGTDPGGVGSTPGVTVPGVTVPGGSTPGVTVPGVTVPGVTVPGVTPPVSLPPVTVPPVVPGVVDGVGGLLTTVTGTVGGVVDPVTGILPPLLGTGGSGSSGGGSGGGLLGLGLGG